MRKRHIAQMAIVSYTFLSIGLLTGCGSWHKPSAALSVLDATLWLQHSAEYRALALQTYRLARDRLDEALQDSAWTAALEQKGNYRELPPAVILDVDETVLNTASYSAQLIRDHASHTEELWSRWYEEVGGHPLPGAVDFCRYATECGVSIFYVTNNKDYMRETVRAELKAAGFPFENGTETLLTRTDAGDKSPRRAAVAQGYRILLVIGDDANDFASGFGGASLEERANLYQQYAIYWGRGWIVLPNPMYGSWERALFGNEVPSDPGEQIRLKTEALQFD